MKLKPEILCHLHIPKPLHGLSPRTIMGRGWWDETRQAVYASTDYHCAACGVHKSAAKERKWLEAHEFLNVDYKTGVCEIISIEPLCHYCHNFIHSGRLGIIIGTEKSKQEVIEILEHGFKILAEHKLSCFPFTYDLAKQLKCKTFNVKPYELLESFPWEKGAIRWGDWKLIWMGKEYKSKFKSFDEWDYFCNKNEM